ncbi:MAG: KEOPS complex subunit Cgi121 [Thermoplasmatota archaeon]
MMNDDQIQVCALTVQGPLRLDDVLFQARKAQRLAPLQVVRSDRVLGFDHIRSAAQHMWRAMEEGRNQADKPEVEFTRYLSGQRTIKDALQHVGIQDGAPQGTVIAFGPERGKAVEYFVEMLGLIEGEPREPSQQAILDFGIDVAAWEATAEDRRMDLILEAVAAVDLARS